MYVKFTYVYLLFPYPPTFSFLIFQVSTNSFFLTFSSFKTSYLKQVLLNNRGDWGWDRKMHAFIYKLIQYIKKTMQWIIKENQKLQDAHGNLCSVSQVYRVGSDRHDATKATISLFFEKELLKCKFTYLTTVKRKIC